MSKTITISTRVQLQEYHQELQKKESEARKDKCVLLALTFAGLIGVYALVINGIHSQSVETAPITLEESSSKTSDQKAKLHVLN